MNYLATTMFPAAATAAAAAGTSVTSVLTTAQMTAVAAGTGAITGATSHLIANKGSFKGLHKSILMGAAGGGIASYVSHGLYGLDSSKPLLDQGLLKVGGNIVTKAAANALVKKALRW